MKLKKIFDRIKYISTSGHPDIFWKWLGESTLIIVITVCITTFIVIYLKSKGLL